MITPMEIIIAMSLFIKLNKLYNKNETIVN